MSNLEQVVDLERLFEQDDFQRAFCRNCPDIYHFKNISCCFVEGPDDFQIYCARRELYDFIWLELKRAKNAIIDAMQARGCE